MKKLFLNNLHFKLFSILISVILWILIVNIDDPVITKKYSDILVGTVNESVIYNKGKVYEVKDNSNYIDVYVKAKRSIIKYITSDNISAIADFNNLMMDKLVPIDIKLDKYQSQVESVSSSPNNMIISIEDSISKTFAINITTEGEVGKGYFISEKNLKIDNINISGPKSIINKVNTVSAPVKITNLTKDKSFNVEPVYLDSDGEIIDSSLITSDLDEVGIDVEIKVLKAKSVPINVVTTGKVAEGYTIDDITTTPEKIDIIGAVDAMNSVSEIVISGESVNVNNFAKTMENTFNIKEFLPSGINIADYEDENVVVVITISPMGSKEISYPVSSIVIENPPYGLKINYGSLKSIPIVLSGNKKSIENIKASDIKVVLDLKSIKKPGEYTQGISIIADNNIILAKETSINFKLVEE